MDWVTYPILRFSDSPEMEIALLAVANAVFEATGVRPRQMPFTPERIRAALIELQCLNAGGQHIIMNDSTARNVFLR
jgi:hypothetical protein